MYKYLVFKKVMMGILTIVVSAGILALIIFLSLPSLANFSEGDQMLVAFFFTGCYILVWWYVFWRYLLKIRIKPNQVSKSKSLEEIKNQFRECFSEAKFGNDLCFSVEDIDGGLQVSWNKKIDYNQILSSGKNEVEYKVSFLFDERNHICNIHTLVRRISKSVGVFGLFGSLSFSSGVIYEVGVNYVPSFSIEDGNVKIDIKKLSYGNATIIDPAVEILKTGGWTSNFLMLKHKISRIIYAVIGWVLFLFSIFLILIGMLGFLNGNESKSDKNIIKNIEYITSIYNDQNIYLNIDGTYTEYLPEGITKKGSWEIDKDTLRLSYGSKSNDNNIKLELKNGIFSSKEYVSKPSLVFFKDFSGLQSDLFSSSSNTYKYSIWDYAYSPEDMQYLISLRGFEDINGVGPVFEYRCMLIDKVCVKSNLLADANFSFREIYKKIAKEAFDRISIKNKDIIYSEILLMNLVWKLWNAESGNIFGYISNNSDEKGHVTAGLLFHSKKDQKNSPISNEFDSTRFEQIYEKTSSSTSSVGGLSYPKYVYQDGDNVIASSSGYQIILRKEDQSAIAYLGQINNDKTVGIISSNEDIFQFEDNLNENISYDLFDQVIKREINNNGGAEKFQLNVDKIVKEYGVSFYNYLTPLDRKIYKNNGINIPVSGI